MVGLTPADEEVDVRTASYSQAIQQPRAAKETSFPSLKGAAPLSVIPPIQTPKSDSGKAATHKGDGGEAADAEAETGAVASLSGPYAKYSDRLGWLWLFLSFWYVATKVVLLFVALARYGGIRLGHYKGRVPGQIDT